MIESRSDDRALLARLETLEASRRRSRRTLIAAACVALAAPLLSLAGPGADDVVRAKTFELLNDDGKVRATLGYDVKGNPQLELRDKNGKARARVRMDDGEGPMIAIYDEKQNLRGALSMDKGGLPHFILSDRGQKPRLHMAVSEQDAPSLIFIHKDGRMPAGIGVLRDGKPWLRPDPDKGK